MNVVLIGYRCAGKTSVGREISKRLGIPFLDTDQLVEQRCGKSVREIVSEGGWGWFRRMEKEVIKGLVSRDGTVISVGGGAVEEQENRDMIRRLGVVIWLSVHASAVLQRMKEDQITFRNRPPLSDRGTEEEIMEKLRERIPLYRGLAQLTVDTTAKGIQAVAGEICRLLAALGPGFWADVSREG